MNDRAQEVNLSDTVSEGPDLNPHHLELLNSLRVLGVLCGSAVKFGVANNQQISEEVPHFLACSEFPTDHRNPGDAEPAEVAQRVEWYGI